MESLTVNETNLSINYIFIKFSKLIYWYFQFKVDIIFKSMWNESNLKGRKVSLNFS